MVVHIAVLSLAVLCSLPAAAAPPDQGAALKAAELRRVEALRRADATLMATTDKVLQADPARLDSAALSRYLGYRIMRGHLTLAALNRAAKPLARKAQRKLIARFASNQGALVEELTDARRRGQERAYTRDLHVDPAHREMAERLGAGNTPHEISFLKPHTAARMGAHFLCLGRTAIFQQVSAELETPPVTYDKRWAKQALAWLDFAVADITRHEKNFKERETIRALDLAGECLLTMRRKEDAVTRWQQILDDYPTSREFPRIQQKIKKALGIP